MRLSHRLALAIVLMSLLAMLFPISVAMADDVITFPDPNLEAAIRAAINKPSGEIYQSDLDGLTTLGAPDLSITNLTGLEHCTNLTWLRLDGNQISNISPLAGLTNLTYLELGRNHISDLSPLAGLTNLTTLYLYNNQISNISPLAGLTNLTELLLMSNQISDISPLAGLTNLTGLSLNYNQISNISPLAGLTNLTGLSLDYNHVSDLSPLAGLTNLTGLSLYHTQISNLSPLAGLTNLTRLYLDSNQISDLSVLSGLTNLTYLLLGDNHISDIGPLVSNTGLGTGDWLSLSSNPLSTTSVNVYIPQLQARGVDVLWEPVLTLVTFPDPNLEAAIRAAINKPSGDIYQSDLDGLTSLSADTRGIANLTGLEHCTSLTSLNLFRNWISDISPVVGLTSLTYLNLEANRISDFGPLSGLTSLSQLYLSQNLTSGDLSPLSGLTSLTDLSLGQNLISDLSPLSGLTSLTDLSLDNNHISDVSPLSGLTSLTGLLLYNNQISNISPLSGLTSLAILWLSDNQISDISPLSGLTSLTYLDLNGNLISDLSPLSGLTKLERLYLGYNHLISDISPLSGLTSLTYLHLEWNHLISDISPLAGLIHLTQLDLSSNQISDIEPLVSNAGISSGDEVYIWDNPLSSTSVDTYIPQLQARGVTVYYSVSPTPTPTPTPTPAPTPTSTPTPTPNTPIGSPTVPLPNAVVTFQNVTGAGTTSVNWSADNPGGPTPPNFYVHGLFMNISTTATYTDTVNVCMGYDESGVTNENNLRLFHWNGAIWEDVTTLPVDTVNNIICGNVTTLSPFFVGEPAAQVQTATGTGTARFSVSSGTIENLAAVTEGSLPTEGKPSLVFPHGFFRFDITGLSNGQTVTVVMELPSNIPTNAQYWKWDSSLGWHQINFSDNDGDRIIAIQLTDNGIGDSDPIPGQIHDDGGPGNPSGGGGGAAGVPVFPNIYIGIAAALGAGILAYLVRRRLLAHS